MSIDMAKLLAWYESLPDGVKIIMGVVSILLAIYWLWLRDYVRERA